MAVISYGRDSYQGKLVCILAKINSAQSNKREDVSIEAVVKAGLEFAAKTGMKSLCIELS